MDIPHFIYRLMNIYVHFLALKNNAMVNILVQVLLWTYFFSSL